MVRKAETADIKKIAAIWGQLHDKHIEIRPDYFNSPTQNQLENEIYKMLLKGEKTFIVSEEDNIIQGYAEIFLDETQESETRTFYKRCFIEQLAVDSEYQRNGVGKSLVLS